MNFLRTSGGNFFFRTFCLIAREKSSLKGHRKRVEQKAMGGTTID